MQERRHGYLYYDFKSPSLLRAFIYLMQQIVADYLIMILSLSVIKQLYLYSLIKYANTGQ